MAISEILYTLIITPKDGIQKFRLFDKALLISIVTVLLAIFSQTLALSIINPPVSNYLAFSLSFGLISKFLLFSIFWMFITAIFHFFASWSKGLTKAKELFVLIGIDFFPLLLLPAVAILSKALGNFEGFVYFMLNLFLLVWVIRLQILSLKELYTLTTEKAFFIFIAPGLILLAFGTILTIIGIGSILFLINSNL